MTLPPKTKRTQEPMLLFRVRRGTVTAEVRGPRIGWSWRVIRYYRWQVSTREPGVWEQLPPDRAVDQIYLGQCVKAVRGWLKEDERPDGLENS